MNKPLPLTSWPGSQIEFLPAASAEPLFGKTSLVSHTHTRTLGCGDVLCHCLMHDGIIDDKTVKQQLVQIQRPD